MLLGETLFLLHCGKMHTFSGLFAFQPHRATSVVISLKSGLLAKSSKVVTVSMYVESTSWIPPPLNFDVLHIRFCIDIGGSINLFFLPAIHDLFFLWISIHLKVNRIIPSGVKYFSPQEFVHIGERTLDGLLLLCFSFFSFFLTGCCHYAFLSFFLTGCCYYAFLVRTKRAQCRHSFLFSRASPSFLRRSRKYTGCALAFHNDVNEYEK